MTTRPLTFGIQTLGLAWSELADRWPRYDADGWDSLWIPDHLANPVGGGPLPFLDAWTALGGLAMATSRARIGVLVSSTTFRHPAIIARQAVTLDQISNGRSILGLGAGWFEAEHEAFGIPFPDTGERVSLFGDALAYLDTYLRTDQASYEGTHFTLRNAPNVPGPVQSPRMPIIVGGHGPRVIRLAAPYMDIWNSRGTTAEIQERIDVLDRACDRIGRDPAEIVRSVGYFPFRTPEAKPWSSPDAFVNWVEQYRALGITDFIFDEPFPEDMPMARHIAHEILPLLRRG